jgi:DNA-binding response OmpR family regulator
MSVGRLLIVDDEPDFCEFVRRAFVGLDYDVEVTTTAKAFKTTYKRFAPSVIVLDVVIPDVDGIEIVQWLAAQGCTAGLLILSGANPLYAEAAEVVGKVTGKMPIKAMRKPVSAVDLRAAVEALQAGDSQ